MGVIEFKLRNKVMGKKLKKVLTDATDLTLSILPALAGVLSPELATNPQAVIAGVGSIILTNKLSKFYGEYKEKKEKGQIREDLNSIQDSLFDLLKFINENPDDIRLGAIKKLFFKSVAPGTPESEQQLTFELIQICKQLSTNDLMVLKAAYEVVEGAEVPRETLNSRGRNSWFLIISQKIGHNITSLVEVSEAHLVELKLITPAEDRDHASFFPQGNYRLTDLAVRLCQYLTSE